MKNAFLRHVRRDTRFIDSLNEQKLHARYWVPTEEQDEEVNVQVRQFRQFQNTISFKFFSLKRIPIGS